MSTRQPLYDRRFIRLLEAFDREELENDRHTVYGAWPDLTLAYLNLGWFEFAEANGGSAAIANQWTLGRSLLDAAADPLRPFFAEHYQRCLREDRPWEHTYECSSAELYREFHMTAFPLGQAEGLLIVHAPRIERPHTRTSEPPLEGRYRDEFGIIVQCCHCRRVKRNAARPAWDWVPEWVRKHPEATSHGVCPACCGFYYCEARLDLAGLVEPFSTVCCERPSD